MRPSLILATLAVGLAASRLHGQQPDLSTGSCSAAVGGTIVGQLVSDSTGRPVNGAQAGVRDPECTAVPDSAGRFVLTHVPPGMRDIRALGFNATHGSATVPVSEGDTVRVEVRVWSNDPIHDCAHAPHCARLLVPPPARELRALTDEARLREAADRTALTIVGAVYELMDEGWVPCIEEPDGRVRGVLRTRFPTLALSTAYRMQPGHFTISEPPHMWHLPSGRPAFVVRVDAVVRSGDHATVRSHYAASPLWAEGWVCRFDRVGSDWLPRSCVEAWIS